MPTLFRICYISVVPNTNGIATSRMLHSKQWRSTPDGPQSQSFNHPNLYQCAYPAQGVQFLLDIEREPAPGDVEPCEFKLIQQIGEKQHTVTTGIIDPKTAHRQGDKFVFKVIESDADGMKYTFIAEELHAPKPKERHVPGPSVILRG